MTRAVALAGNPNVGKSSLFNALTGLHQHTGNWPGKTVAVAQGSYAYAAQTYAVTDLPGTYSLQNGSEEERIAAEYLRRHSDGCIVAVCDATCLARSLSLAVALMQRCRRVIVCVNLMDEARRAGLALSLHSLQALLGVPVIGTCASSAEDIRRLRQLLRDVFDGYITLHPHVPEQRSAADCVRYARQLAAQIVSGAEPQRRNAQLDAIFTGKYTGPAVFAALLFALLWLTLVGSNQLSDWLQLGFDQLQRVLLSLCARLPATLTDALIHGVYATTARVVAVMLPPAALFFLLFSLLEDVGYLPRAAFLADHALARCGSSGRQALSMCMGLGCNAVGVVGCRIMPTQREKLIAITTNSLIPCNGRFPMLLTMAAVLLGTQNSVLLALVLLAAVLVGIGGSLGLSCLLSHLLSSQAHSPFILELPPYRRPQAKKLLYDAFIGKTLHVLSRAALVAAPAGLALWLLGHVQVGESSLLQWLCHALDGVGTLVGMNGAVLLGFVLALPANELAIPVIVMLLSGGTQLQVSGQLDTLRVLGGALSARSAACCLIFCVFHWPCATTLQSIRAETGSWRWTLLSAALPTALGALLCMLVQWLF